MDIEVQTELVSGLAVKVVRGNAYDRIQVDGKTIAYAVPAKRAGGIKLDFSNGVLTQAPARFTRLLEEAHLKGNRVQIYVGPRNVKTASALLEWVAKQ